jgi:hypothetical protein
VKPHQPGFCGLLKTEKLFQVNIFNDQVRVHKCALKERKEKKAHKLSQVAFKFGKSTVFKGRSEKKT